MKKISFIILLFILFVLAYQVRTGFFLSKDYNDPGDSHEYMSAAANAAKAFEKIDSPNTFLREFPVMLNAFDSHSAPATIAYYTLINLLTLDHNRINILLSSIFVIFIFLLCRRLFPLWIAIFISLIAVIYTPLYSLIYSFMPERFGSFYIPVMIVLASYFASRAKSSPIYAIITGVLLGLASLYRIEFRWIGIPFVFIWTAINFYESKISNKKREVKQIIFSGILMFLFYSIFSIGWILASKIFNPNPYYSQSFITHVFYNTYNYALYGWNFDTSPVRSFSQFWTHIVSQGPIQLVWLQLALVIRLWSRPATVYANEYLISDSLLFMLHYLMIGLAIIGFRRIFSKKLFLFLFIPLAWVSTFSYIPEDLRRQIPLVGLMLIFAGAGVNELMKIFNYRKLKFLLAYLVVGFLLLTISRGSMYGMIAYIYPPYTSIFPLRIFFFLFTLGIFVKISFLFFQYDKKSNFLIKNHYIKIIPSLIPLIAFLGLSWYNARTHFWHEWTTVLQENQTIKQVIKIDEKTLYNIKKTNGYLLVDLKDKDGGKDLKISLNGKIVNDRLKVIETFSPIDLRVIRQFQRGMPRLGFGTVEESVQSLQMFPNMHYWLITKVSGELISRNNEIIIRNISSNKDEGPILYGDYFSNSSNNTYHGPTPLIFQGPGSFLKYEVDGDIRLTLKRNLLSTENKSIFYIDSNRSFDLSTSFGLQTGRYRIFLLSPFPNDDPVYLF